MPVESILDAARIGMAHERLRLDAASRNIAGVNVPVAAGQTAMKWRVDASSADFNGMLTGQSLLREEKTDFRQVYDPSHPLADASGNVRYPDTDMVEEMTTLIGASRGYEANVRAFNLLRSMTLRALEIGAK
jgi:flagellar basal-body rod protein FlgC